MSDLAVLACDGCGEPLAIGDADWVLCPACGKQQTVPQVYRALREANAETIAARTQVEAFYRRLARGPRWQRWLVRRFGMDRAVTLFVVVLIAYALALLAAPWVLLWGAWQIFADAPQVNLYQVLGPAERGFVYGLGVFVALLVPALAWWLTGWHRSQRRERLAAALAAGRPKREGGPAVCRACGAPLSVSPGAVAASCLYCRAENLLVPSSEVLASAEQRELTLDDVVAEEAWQRRRVWRGLAAAIVVPAGIGLMMVLAVWLFAGNAYTAADSDGGLRCSKPICTEWRATRLGRNDHIDLVLVGTAAGPPKVRLDGQRITPFPRAWIPVGDARVDDAGHARLVAPWDGWFRVVVTVPGPADATFGVVRD